MDAVLFSDTLMYSIEFMDRHNSFLRTVLKRYKPRWVYAGRVCVQTHCVSVFARTSLFDWVADGRHWKEREASVCTRTHTHTHTRSLYADQCGRRPAVAAHKWNRLVECGAAARVVLNDKWRYPLFSKCAGRTCIAYSFADSYIRKHCLNTRKPLSL
jgi:hypothetical protein